MPRVRGEKYINDQVRKFKETGDRRHLHDAIAMDDKHAVRNTPKPKVLYHGSPQKLKRGQKIEPRGPMFYNTDPKSRRARLAVHATKSKGDAKAYSKQSDSGGINKKRYGKKLEPKVFAKKGYLYEIHTDKHKGWMKQYHGGASEPNHWASHRAQGWEKRSTVRHKGKLPITRGEAVVAGGVILGAGYGGYRLKKHFDKSHQMHANRGKVVKRRR